MTMMIMMMMVIIIIIIIIQGRKEQLIIDSVVLEQAHKDNRNLYIAYNDYCKAFDSVPHSWLACIDTWATCKLNK